MLQLKNNIINISREKRVGVRGGKLIIEGKAFFWNSQANLVCDNSDGKEALRQIYGDAILSAQLDYTDLLRE